MTHVEALRGLRMQQQDYHGTWMRALVEAKSVEFPAVTDTLIPQLNGYVQQYQTAMDALDAAIAALEG